MKVERRLQGFFFFVLGYLIHPAPYYLELHEYVEAVMELSDDPLRKSEFKNNLNGNKCCGGFDLYTLKKFLMT